MSDASNIKPGSRKLCVLQESAGRSAPEPGRTLPPPVFLAPSPNIVPAGKGRIQVPSLFSWGKSLKGGYLDDLDVRVNKLITNIRFPHVSILESIQRNLLLQYSQLLSLSTSPHPWSQLSYWCQALRTQHK